MVRLTGEMKQSATNDPEAGEFPSAVILSSSANDYGSNQDFGHESNMSEKGLKELFNICSVTYKKKL